MLERHERDMKLILSKKRTIANTDCLGQFSKLYVGECDIPVVVVVMLSDHGVAQIFTLTNINSFSVSVGLSILCWIPAGKMKTSPGW